MEVPKQQREVTGMPPGTLLVQFIHALKEEAEALAHLTTANLNSGAVLEQRKALVGDGLSIAHRLSTIVADVAQQAVEIIDVPTRATMRRMLAETLANLTIVHGWGVLEARAKRQGEEISQAVLSTLTLFTRVQSAVVCGEDGEGGFTIVFKAPKEDDAPEPGTAAGPPADDGDHFADYDEEFGD